MKDSAEDIHLHQNHVWSQITQRILPHNNYTVGIVCAFFPEISAAAAMLDEIHADLVVQSYDSNAYTLGNICGHIVVIAYLPAGIWHCSCCCCCNLNALQFRLNHNATNGGYWGGEYQARSTILDSATWWSAFPI